KDSPLAPLLRPLGANLLGHFHAACFPYRPLQKGRIDLQPSVAGLFEGFNLQAVLHLLSDPREFIGAGESEFLRGALWIAPVLDSAIRTPHSAIA
ncbi:MAG: anti-sigma factor antagonist, partial [Verrucomicrobiota bacterium]